MKPLSGIDGAFLHLETPETPMHVASLHLLERPAGDPAGFHAEVRRQMARRLALAPVLTRRLAPLPWQIANPVWVRDDAVDLEHHVRRITLPRPGSARQLEEAVARLHAELLDRTRPLWQLVVVDGLADGQVGYYFKAHHAALDGQAGVLLARALFDTAPNARLPRPRRADAPAAEQPGLAEIAAAALRHDAGQLVKLVRQLPEVMRAVAGLAGLGGGEDGGAPSGRLAQNFAFGPRTPLNAPIGGARAVALQSLPIDALHEVAAAHEAKLNDVVLALASGALRRWLAHHGGIPAKPLTAAMPISLREPGDTEFTTRATMPLVNLQTHIADPVRRLRAIRDAAGAVKSMVARARGVVPTDFPSLGTPWLLHALAELYGRSHVTAVMPPLANVVISNVPGPQVPLYVCGARMTGYYPLSIVEHGLGLNLTVLSYAGTMGFGLVTARNLVRDPRPIARALVESFDELRARTPRRRARPAPRSSAKEATQ